MNPATD